jgi:hypothetical protein
MIQKVLTNAETMKQFFDILFTFFVRDVTNLGGIFVENVNR